MGDLPVLSLLLLTTHVKKINNIRATTAKAKNAYLAASEPSSP